MKFESVHKYVQLENHIMEMIQNKQFPPGSKIPSERDMAKDYSMSILTINKAISDLVNRGILIRIHGKGTFVADAPFQERKSTGGVITLVGSDTRGYKEFDPFYEQILKGIHDSVDENNQSVRMLSVPPDKNFRQTVSEQGMHIEDFSGGVIFAGYEPSKDDYGFLRSEDKICLSIGKTSEDFGIPYVDSDNYKGMQKGIEHLLNLGHRAIALFDCQSHIPSFNARQKAFRDAFENRNLRFDERLFLRYTPSNISDLRPQVNEFLKAAPKFTAAIVYGDCCTFALYYLLNEHKIKIPTDVSILMYSGYKWVDDVIGVEISKIAYPPYRLGMMAAQTLNEMKTPGRKYEISVEPELIPGETCSKVKLT